MATARQSDSPPIPKRLQRLADNVKDPNAGFFGPGSMMWKLSRERALLLGGASSVLLQLAHPQVAAGVKEHSDFESDPVGRFNRTFDVVYGIVFGDADTALYHAANAWHIHKKVQGAIHESPGTFEKGDRYHANRPDLLLWVHATLIEQALRAYPEFVGPLSEDERRRYYEDTKIFGRLFGIPDEQLPPDLDAFFEYYNDMVENVLVVGEVGMRLRKILLGPLPKYWVVAPMNRVLAAALLPERTREQYELPWTPRTTFAYRRIRNTARRLVNHLPERFRFEPRYLEARARLEDSSH